MKIGNYRFLVYNPPYKYDIIIIKQVITILYIVTETFFIFAFDDLHKI